MAKASNLYRGKDPRDVPMYGFAEAAGMLHIPTSTLRSWTVGQDYTVRGTKKRFHPPVPLEAGQHRLTFYNLIEAYVLSTMRRDFNVTLPAIRTSVDYVRREMDIARPLLDEDFYTDGVSLLVQRSGAFVNVSKQGQLAMENVLKDSLRRIERDEAGLASRLYPWRTDIREPRIVEIDPRRAMGKPVVAGTNISVDVLISRRHAGDSIERLARDFALDKRKVEAVVNWNGAAA